MQLCGVFCDHDLSFKLHNVGEVRKNLAVKSGVEVNTVFTSTKFNKDLVLCAQVVAKCDRREFKKLRRQLQGKRCIKIELCVKSLAIIPC